MNGRPVPHGVPSLPDANGSETQFRQRVIAALKELFRREFHKTAPEQDHRALIEMIKKNSRDIEELKKNEDYPLDPPPLVGFTLTLKARTLNGASITAFTVTLEETERSTINGFVEFTQMPEGFYNIHIRSDGFVGRGIVMLLTGDRTYEFLLLTGGTDAGIAVVEENTLIPVVRGFGAVSWIPHKDLEFSCDILNSRVEVSGTLTAIPQIDMFKNSDNIIEENILSASVRAGGTLVELQRIRYAITTPEMLNVSVRVGGVIKKLFILTTEINIYGGGTITRLPNAQAYANGEVVNVTAVPSAGYLFRQWVGASSSTDAAIAVTMDGNKTLVAEFDMIAP